MDSSLSFVICLILDLHNREIVGYAADKHKSAAFVVEAFSKIKSDLSKISMFHTNWGSEFKNKIIKDLTTTFRIQRSLSKKGYPYDNAVAEATYKIVKTEFTLDKVFDSFDELKRELFD